MSEGIKMNISFGSFIEKISFLVLPNFFQLEALLIGIANKVVLFIRYLKESI